MKLPEDLALPSNGEALMCILLGRGISSRKLAIFQFRGISHV